MDASSLLSTPVPSYFVLGPLVILLVGLVVLVFRKGSVSPIAPEDKAAQVVSPAIPQVTPQVTSNATPPVVTPPQAPATISSFVPTSAPAPIAPPVAAPNLSVPIPNISQPAPTQVDVPHVASAQAKPPEVVGVASTVEAAPIAIPITAPIAAVTPLQTVESIPAQVQAQVEPQQTNSWKPLVQEVPSPAQSPSAQVIAPATPILQDEAPIRA